VEGNPEVGDNKFGNHGGNRRNNRGCRNNVNNFNNYRTGQNGSCFEGSKPMQKGFVYDYTGERNTDHFIKTTKQLRIYVGCMYTKFTTDFLDAVYDLYLDDTIDVFKMEDFKEEKKEYRVKSREYSNFKSGFHTVIYGQCTESLKDKLKVAHQL